jgi:hypothetical protein
MGVITARLTFSRRDGRSHAHVQFSPVRRICLGPPKYFMEFLPFFDANDFPITTVTCLNLHLFMAYTTVYIVVPCFCYMTKVVIHVDDFFFSFYHRFAFPAGRFGATPLLNESRVPPDGRQ